MNASVVVPLETPYRGCRFRSRLEARWAVFYDHIGVKWSYENDPVRVGGENYLPDFMVTDELGTRFFHEVKPDNSVDMIRAQRVYLAGKMRPEHDWRGPLSPLSRSKRFGVCYDDLECNPSAWLDELKDSNFSLENTWFNLTGPLPSSCDHGCAHSSLSLHMAQTCSGDIRETEIVAACCASISASDIVCAHLNTVDCYGTLVEIGIGKGLGKKVCVTIDATLVDQLERQNSHNDNISGSNTLGTHDLWFACETANHSVVVDDSAHARRIHSQFIARHTPREYRLISTLALSEKIPSVLTFGDPHNVAMYSTALNWGTSLMKMCRSFPEASTKARSFRFAG